MADPEAQGPLRRLEIREMLERSSDAVNRQDWNGFLELMDDGVVWERLPPTPWRLDGLAAVRDFLLGNAGQIEIIYYAITGVVIALDGDDRASVRSTMNEMIRNRASGKVIQVIGAYEDRLVRQRNSWKFLSRTIQPRLDPDPDRQG